MFAIVDIAGFQEKVEKGSKLRVPTLKCEEGKTMKISEVLFIEDGGKITVGEPHGKGASVELKVFAHGRDDKILVRKMKRRKRYRRLQGHRQGYTEVEVTKVSIGS